MNKEYDVVILGGGTGGYIAAIRAAQLGLRTAIVEKEKLGGTCLHKGCMPSKALLKSAEVYRLAKHDAASYGVQIDQVTLDFKRVQERKNEVIQQLYQGVQGLMKKGKIDVFKGIGRMLGPSIFSPMPGTISVEMNSGEDNEILTLKNLILATGSKAKSLSGLAFDGEFVLSSDDALGLEKLPASIIIIGGGVIGIEWASMLNDFGVKVTILENGPRILPTEDAEISYAMEKSLVSKGVHISTNARVLADTVEKTPGQVRLDAEIDAQTERYQAEKVLVSIGREANLSDIGLQNTEIEVEHNVVKTTATYQTKESHIYAIGDMIGNLQLAHVAAHEGIHAVEHIAGIKNEPLQYEHISRCIYTSPEIASVGLTEDQAIKAGYQIKTGKFPLQAIGKAHVNGNTDGFVKMIADKVTDDVLGVHMIGAGVTELISEAGLALVLNATPWEVASTIHPHPSLSEVIGEAALAVDQKAIHM